MIISILLAIDFIMLAVVVTVYLYTSLRERRYLKQRADQSLELQQKVYQAQVLKEIGERIQVKLTQGNYIPKGIDVQSRTYSYPKEARTKEEFLKGCRLFLKED